MNRSVLMVAPYFPPLASSGVFRTLRFVKYLPEHGWQPRVLSRKPRPNARRDEALLDQVPEEMAVRRVEAWFDRPRRETVAKVRNRPANLVESQNGSAANGNRLVGLARNGWQLLTQTPDQHVWWALPAARQGETLSRQWNVDVVYTTGPPHSTHLIGHWLKRRTGIPWVADFRDPWSRAPWGVKPRNPWGQKLRGRFEKNCVRAADAVVLNTERMASEFRLAYPDLPPDHFQAIPNGIDPKLFTMIPPAIGDNEQTKTSPDGITLLHPGSLYHRRDPRPLLEALRTVVDHGRRVRFIQLGPVSEKFGWDQMVCELKLTDHVTKLPPSTHAEALARMGEADVLVMLQPETAIQVPGKLYEMLAFRKPILAITCEGATADIVTKYRIGMVALDNKATEIARCLEQLAQRNGLPSDSRFDEACTDYDGRMLAGKLADLFSVCISRKVVRS